MARIRTVRRIKRTSTATMPVTLQGAARALPAPAMVKNHGDKLGEAFK